MNWTLISAVNNEDVVRSCLLSSPEIGSASATILQRGFTSVAVAYNTAIEKAQTDVIVLAHQDVYFPIGWIEALHRSVEFLSREDVRWSVLGVWGVKGSGVGVGNLYCAATQQRLGESFAYPVEVTTLDEVVLVVRKSSGVRFDEAMPGFHMYGTDICLEAQRRGMKCYAISAFCIHNTNGYNLLPRQFWKAYFLMRRKWRSQLPITTSCTRITFWCWPMVYWNLDRVANLLLGRHKPGRRVPDPSQLYREKFAASEKAAGVAGFQS